MDGGRTRLMWDLKQGMCLVGIRAESVEKRHVGRKTGSMPKRLDLYKAGIANVH